MFNLIFVHFSKLFIIKILKYLFIIIYFKSKNIFKSFILNLILKFIINYLRKINLFIVIINEHNLNINLIK